MQTKSIILANGKEEEWEEDRMIEEAMKME